MNFSSLHQMQERFELSPLFFAGLLGSISALDKCTGTLDPSTSIADLLDLGQSLLGSTAVFIAKEDGGEPVPLRLRIKAHVAEAANLTNMAIFEHVQTAILSLSSACCISGARSEYEITTIRGFDHAVAAAAATPAAAPRPALAVVPLLIVLLLCAPARAAQPAADTLAEGQAALSRGEVTHAHRLCQRAAEQTTGQPHVDALVCQGRASLRMNLPLQSIRLGMEALRIPLTSHVAAHILLGDVYRQQDNCREARPHYLMVLEITCDPMALQGLQQCGGDPPKGRCPDRTESRASLAQVLQQIGGGR